MRGRFSGGFCSAYLVSDKDGVFGNYKDDDQYIWESGSGVSSRFKLSLAGKLVKDLGETDLAFLSQLVKGVPGDADCGVPSTSGVYDLPRSHRSGRAGRI